MMYKFHIIGFAASPRDRTAYFSDNPVDITVYSDTEDNALAKAEKILRYTISNHHKRVIIEEIFEK